MANILDVSSAETSVATPRSSTWLATITAQSLLLGGMLTINTAFNLLTLLRSPAPFWDETWNASRAWGLIQTGRPFGFLDGGAIEQFPGYWTYFPWLATAVHAASVEIFGLNIFALRFVSLLFGIILLLTVYVGANRLYGQRTALVATGLVALSQPFIYSSHLGRHDIIAAALGYVAIALYLSDSGTSFSLKSLLCGLTCGIALDIHWNSAIFGLAIGAVYLWQYRLALLRSGRFWGFAAGSALGLGYFLALHVLPYPQTFFDIYQLVQSPYRTPAITTANPLVWLSSLSDTALMLNLLTPLLLAAIIFLARRKEAGDKQLLASLVALLAAFVVVIHPKPAYYAILLAPLALMALAPLLVQLLGALRRQSLTTFVAAGLVLGLLGAYIVGGLTPFLYDAEPEYQAALDLIKQTVPAGSKVIALPTYWLARPEDPAFSTWFQLDYKAGSYDMWPATMRAEQPDFSIVDDSINYPEQLRDILAKQGHMVAELKTHAFGTIRIYQMGWK